MTPNPQKVGLLPEIFPEFLTLEPEIFTSIPEVLTLSPEILTLTPELFTFGDQSLLICTCTF